MLTVGPKAILLVEDDPDIRSILQEFFESEGYQILLAPHGQAALDTLSNSATPKIGLILLDLMMPVMDGPTFLLEFERNFSDLFAQTEIFIISAGGRVPGLSVKTVGFLRKPLDLDELGKLAARYCGSAL